jgi:3-deoxy-D-manno-octulosonic-acid transferase
MYFWYKFFTYLFYPFAPIYLYIRRKRGKEDLIRYTEKLSKINSPREEGFLIWFHMASVGEAMSILPMIEHCILEKKIDKILLTSITLSSSRILEKKYGKNLKIIHQFLPLDVPVFVNKFLKHWKPNLSIFVDSEIWPNIIFQIKNIGNPLILLNARITEKSFKRWNLVNNLAKKIFEKFDLCIVSNKESETFLKTLGAKNIKNYGNLKYAQIKSKSDYKLNNHLLDKLKDRKIWCAASTHPSEETLCAETHIQLKNKYKNILTIIIPRHINRVEKIKLELSNLNLKVVTYSMIEQLTSDTDILIIDTYGESLKFYNISKNIFLGKSLVKNLLKNSGQNPIEPARFGCKVFHGPYVSNFTEIYNYLKILNVTKEVKNSEDLSLSLVEEFEKNYTKNQENIIKIHNYGQNIFNNVIMELKKYI